MRKVHRVIAVAIAAALGCGGTPEQPPARLPSPGCRAGQTAAIRADERTLVVDGAERSYLLDVPWGPADEPRPVLMVFHAFGARGRRLRRWSNLGRMAHRRGLIAVFPDGLSRTRGDGRTGRGWDDSLSDARDVAFVAALLDRIEADWCVDRDRVWATGMSDGGLFAELLGCRLADRVRGIAPVAGARVIEGCHPSRAVSTLIIHGRGDGVVPVDSARAARDWWLLTAGCGAPRQVEHCRFWDACRDGTKMGYCEAGQRHVWPRPAGRRILDFFGTSPRPPKSGASPPSEPARQMPGPDA